ncbi:MAG: replicative DNA helicase [Clostridia bacterium]|nr:replicative DNA helicase [Clostridia bacterium]
MDREFGDNLIENNAALNEGSPSSRSLPCDIISEKAILQLCMANPDIVSVVAGKKLKSEDFYDSRNQLIFIAISDIYMSGKRADFISVSNELSNKGKLNQAGGTNYLYEVANFMAVASNIDAYIDYVKDKSRSRQLINYLGDLTKLAYDDKNEASTIIDTAVGGLSSMRDAGTSGLTSLGAQIRENLQELHDITTGKKKIVKIRTGFKGLDFHLGGLKPGALYIIAARPGMGKTSLAINIATNAALNYNETVCFFSLEMSKKELANKILITRSNVDGKKLQRAETTPAEEQELASSLTELARIPFYIDDDSQTNPITMRSKLKQKMANGGVSVVVVDYIGLMTMPNIGKNTSRQQEIADISRNLKLLAMELQVPVIALSQLSRGAEQREDHTPMLSDLRDSGAIEQDADAVIFIDRDSYYRDKTDKKKTNDKNSDGDGDKDTNSNQNSSNDSEVLDAKIIVAKNRAGSTGTCKVLWIPKKTLFVDPVRDNGEPPEGYMSKVSAFSRTTDAASASGNYSFEEPPMPEEPYVPSDSDVPPQYDEGIPPFEEFGEPQFVPDEVPSGIGEEPGGEPINMDNEEFFADSHSELPPDFM